jgi:hypothetical protein
MLEMPTRVAPPFEVGTLGTLGANENGLARRRKDEDLIHNLVSVLDEQLLHVLQCRQTSECHDARAKVWPKYVRARRALTDTMSNLVPEKTREHLSAAAQAKIAADLDGARGILFGDAVADQMMFSMWVVSKMQAIGEQIAKSSPPKDEDEDRKLIADFHLFAMWGQFHYDCVIASMKFNLALPDDIQEAVCDGLRAWVNASVIVEEALALRQPSVEQAPEVALPWDEEDEQLLASSMRDLDAESSSDHL